MTPPLSSFARLVAVAIFACAGCGRPAGVIFEPLETPLQWPPAPAAARIEYVGTLRTDRDLAPARSGGELMAEAIFGTEPGRIMVSPFGVCTDGASRLFVSDNGAGTVHMFDLDTRRYETWPTGEDDSPFGRPLGLAWDAHGHRLIVADGVEGCLVTFDTAGRRRATLGAEALGRPSGVVVDPRDGTIRVADVTAHQVVVLDRDGAELRRVGERGAGPGQFNFPTNLALDPDGRLYVADSLNFRIQVFDTEGHPLRQIGSQGDRPGYFSQPKGIALDGDGHLYVVDAHFESVQIFDDEGRLLLDFGGEGQAPGRFWLPAGIHIDSSNRVWIADSYNRRVQVFQYRREQP